MEDKKKRVSKLLTNVPDDIMQIVTAHQEEKKAVAAAGMASSSPYIAS